VFKIINGDDDQNVETFNTANRAVADLVYVGKKEAEATEEEFTKTTS
jgi:hypothetical protein